MRQSIIKKLSFANVISVIALFVALSGAAYAGGLDLITGKGIENGSITGKDLAANTITGKQIKEDKLKGTDDCSTPLENGDVCFGPVQPVGTWKQALQNCQRVALKLPSIGEALQVSGQTQLRNTYNWTSDFVDVGPPSTRAVYRTNPAPEVTAKPETDLLPYRCVTIAGDS